jgi:hypothetical protein
MENHIYMDIKIDNTDLLVLKVWTFFFTFLISSKGKKPSFVDFKQSAKHFTVCKNANYLVFRRRVWKTIKPNYKI